MSTIEQPIESVLIQEANFLSAAPIITHTQQIATSLLLRRAANELESLQKACGEMRQLVNDIWDMESPHYEHEPESESGTEWCRECQGVFPHGGHAEDCLYGKIEHALKADCGKDYIHKSQLEAARQRINLLVEELKIAEAHVGWGDCTLENVHARARKLLATEALENEKAS